MATITNGKDNKRPVSVGSRQAVEAAIDAAKLNESQTWEQASQKSKSVPPWTKGNCAKPEPKK